MNSKEIKETVQKFWAPAASGIVLGLIIGLAVNTLWHKDPEIKTVATVQDAVTSETVIATSTNLVIPTLSVVYNTGTDQKALITVNSQKAGFDVVVDEVGVTLPTWVAVREVVGNTVGNILGAKLIQFSEKNVSIDLLRATDPDKQYEVYLYQDDGDQIFDLQRDLLITKGRAPMSEGFVTE